MFEFQLKFRIGCDEDGWTLQVNDEPSYGTFFHLFSSSYVKGLKLKGKVDISYVGFGPKGVVTVIHK